MRERLRRFTATAGALRPAWSRPFSIPFFPSRSCSSTKTKERGAEKPRSRKPLIRQVAERVGFHVRHDVVELLRVVGIEAIPIVLARPRGLGIRVTVSAVARDLRIRANGASLVH